MIKLSLLCLLTILSTGCIGTIKEYDVVVYGATPGGIAAAISARQENLSVALLEPTGHVGGLSTSGLNRDEREHMDGRTFGGISEKFIIEASKRSGFDFSRGDKKARWWQSNIAEEVFLEMLKEAKVELFFHQKLDKVNKVAARIKTITMREGQPFTAKVFIDATYEGDLMAKSDVSYTHGRESFETYKESLAGVRYLDKPLKISPYDNEGKLLPGILPGKPPTESSASPMPIPYNIRMNLSFDPNNSVEITKPENYKRKDYILLERAFESGYLKTLTSIIGVYPMPGNKRECNNRQYSVVSLSIPGGQTAWCESSYEQRDIIYKKYKDYTHGLFWFLKTDSVVPSKIQKEMNRYGFCKDEWADNDHWPWYIYVRAGRRMIGEKVITQHDITVDTDKKDVIHVGSHYIDSHHVARYAYDQDHIINEGRIWQKGVCFDIPYQAITPKRQECENLLVPVAASASNVAFCAIRLEPTWMHLGEVSGIAASMAINNKQMVQKIDISKLQGRIEARGIPLIKPGKEGEVSPVSSPQQSKDSLSFDFQKPLSKDWFWGLGTWQAENGVLKAFESGPRRHGPVKNYRLTFKDITFTYEFRLVGKATHSILPMNGSRERGHMLNLVMAKDKVSIRIHPENYRTNGKSYTLVEKKMNLKSETWHKCQVEISGDKIIARINDIEISGNSKVIAEEKQNFGLGGGSGGPEGEQAGALAFRNLVIKY